MPAIKYKKKTYAGATFPVLEMTKAEYDALPDAKKMDGTVYMITDDHGGWEAERSTYDNTSSGLTATNVQDALDELSSKKLRLSNNVSVTSNSGGGFELQSLCTAAGITNKRNIISIVTVEDYYYVSAPFANAAYAMICDTSTNSKQPNKTITVRAWYYE